jgi:hypothetical protein
MSIVDDRGRVGGRVNLIDLLAVVALVVVVPVAYGSYLLFRTPAPRLLAITPATVHPGPNLRVTVTGENLRPFMRVSFDANQGRTFLIGSTTAAQVDLPDLGPGTYDVVLYDYTQEVSRLPDALTVLPGAPIPTVEMQVSGSFKQVPDVIAEQLQVGLKFPPEGDPLAEIVAVEPMRPATLRLRSGQATLGLPLSGLGELPATLKVKCYTQAERDGLLRCLVPGPQVAAPVEPDSLLTLAGPGAWVNFQIDEVHLAGPPQSVEAHVRFVVMPEVQAKVKAGDVDRGAKLPARSYAATLVSIGGARPIAASEAGGLAPVGGPLRALDVRIRVPIEQVSGGWIYKGEPFKAGAPFTFETPEYIMRGQVSDVVLPPAAGSGQ